MVTFSLRFRFGSLARGWTYFQEASFSGGVEPKSQSKSGVDRLEPAETAEDAANAEIDMGHPELAVDEEEVDVVDALDAGPVGVDDLLVEQVLADEDIFRPDLEIRERRFRSGAEDDGVGTEELDMAPIESPGDPVGPPPDDERAGFGIKLSEPDLEVGGPADDRSVGGLDRPAQELREVEEHLRVFARHNPAYSIPGRTSKAAAGLLRGAQICSLDLGRAVAAPRVLAGQH